jgi:hypothetical protein
MAARAPALVFLHISKTAGTTLRRIAWRQYAPYEVFPLDDAFFPSEEAFRRLRTDLTPRHRLFYGHMAYGLGEHLPMPWAYATFLRDPVARVVSAYRYAGGLPGHPNYRAIREGLSLGDYVRSGLVPQLDNGMTRALSGRWYMEFGAVTEELLDLALEHLDGLRVVGVTSRFDESLLLLAERFGWRRPLWYVRRNVSKGQLPVPADALEAIEEATRFDAILFRRATERLDADVRAGGEAFAGRLRRFRMANRALGLPTQAAYRVRAAGLPKPRRRP